MLSGGYCGLLRPSEVFAPRGRMLLNGAFGVTKNKTVQVPDASAPGGVKKADVVRLIVNLTTLNSIMEVMAGDIRTLPYGGQWSGIMVLPEDQVMVFSDEDLTCAFLFVRDGGVDAAPGFEQGS